MYKPPFINLGLFPGWRVGIIVELTGLFMPHFPFKSPRFSSIISLGTNILERRLKIEAIHACIWAKTSTVQSEIQWILWNKVGCYGEGLAPDAATGFFEVELLNFRPVCEEVYYPHKVIIVWSIRFGKAASST